MSSTDSTRSVLLFAGGVAIGSALAFGAAYGLATYYQNRVDDAARSSRCGGAEARETRDLVHSRLSFVTTPALTAHSASRRGTKSELIRTKSSGASKPLPPRTSTVRPGAGHRCEPDDQLGTSRRMRGANHDHADGSMHPPKHMPCTRLERLLP